MARPAPRPVLPSDHAPVTGDAAPATDTLLDALTWPLIAANRNLEIVYANPAAAELFAIGLRWLIGRPLSELWGGESVAQALVARVQADGLALGEDTLLIQRPDGHALRVSFDAAPFDGAAAIGGGVVIAMRDRTIADRLDRQAAHRDGARSLGAMAAMLAHEIRNPLSGIRGAAQLLAPSLDAGGLALADMICQEVDRIVTVLDTVETLAAGASFEPGAENIHEILDYVCTAASAGFAQGRRIVREYDPSLPPIAGDRARLIQAFLNLMKNAAEATATVGGEIRIATRFDPGLVHVGAGGTRRRIPVVVSITDDGPGIPEAIRAHLFDPFMTTKPQGRGLGLALVARIIADHEGAIDVASEPRRTRFDIMLPVAGDGAGQ